MAAKSFVLVLVGVTLLREDFVDGKPPQVLRSHLRWPDSPNSYLVQELQRHGFVSENHEFVKEKINDEFLTWTHREKLPEIIEGLKYCVDRVIADGHNGDLDAYIQCIDNNESVKMLNPRWNGLPSTQLSPPHK
ncbi:uncharacterized protein LOC135164393 [Diachasmimorpha longicaudata]|uniref:uncharacterized protein LOC135164393 n=1 Tax=Diachasmimorpha longicaudata TaxID=58733 RepID=UPI0030B91A41